MLNSGLASFFVCELASRSWSGFHYEIMLCHCPTIHPLSVSLLLGLSRWNIEKFIHQGFCGIIIKNMVWWVSYGKHMFLKVGFVNIVVSYLELKKLWHRVRGEIYLWLPSCIIFDHVG